MKNSADYLKELREQKNLSCKDMAEILEISKAYYWQLEHGNRRLYYDMAVKIAAIFNRKPDDIFYDKKEDN